MKKGCGCLALIILVILAFTFGPWAVLGWIIFVLVLMAIAGAFFGD